MSKKRFIFYLFTFIFGYCVSYLFLRYLHTDGWNIAVRFFCIYLMPIAFGGLFISIVDSVSNNIHY